MGKPTREQIRGVKCPKCGARRGERCVGRSGRRRDANHAARVKAWGPDPKAEYQAYLRSAHWRDVKRRYRKSGLPQTCVVCGDPRVDLHHKTYERRGREELTDLEPRCRKHHEEAHGLDT
jgi:hypothetical protein